MENKGIIKIGVAITCGPEEGGKFQYTQMVVSAIANLDPARFTRFAILVGETGSTDWLTDSNVHWVKVRQSIVSRILRKVILKWLDGLALWRIVGRWLNPVYRLLEAEQATIVLWPGNDSLSYETPFHSVVPIHDLMHRYEPNFPEVGSSQIYCWREQHYQNICRYASGILVDSELGKQHVIESYSVEPKKVYTLKYAAPSSLYKLRKKTRPSTIPKLPEKYIFYPAQFWKHKNHRLIILALEILKKQGVKVNAVFVGAAKNASLDLNALIKSTRLDNQIIMLGYVSDQLLVELYQEAVALVMPTFFGPTNIPPLEAFALGCPVVISGIYGIPEQVGDAALLFDPNDPYDLAEQIKLLWTDDDLRCRLIAKGKKKHQQWNEDHFSARLQDIISEVVRSISE